MCTVPVAAPAGIDGLDSTAGPAAAAPDASARGGWDCVDFAIDGAAGAGGFGAGAVSRAFSRDCRITCAMRTAASCAWRDCGKRRRNARNSSMLSVSRSAAQRRSSSGIAGGLGFGGGTVSVTGLGCCSEALVAGGTGVDSGGDDACVGAIAFDGVGGVAADCVGGVAVDCVGG